MLLASATNGVQTGELNYPTVMTSQDGVLHPVKVIISARLAATDCRSSHSRYVVARWIKRVIHLGKIGTE